MSWFTSWAERGDPFGWTAFLLASAVLLQPGNLRLALLSIAASTVYYVTQWPFTSNHILLDTFFSAAILGAAIATLGPRLASTAPISAAERDEIVDRFRPVLIAIFAIMYYAIFLSKMNTDFLDPSVSCMQAMYEDFLRREPMLERMAAPLPTGALLTVFMVVELVLPVLLTFRRTRLLACYIGLPFHLVLGVMGHLSYSSLVIALYAVVALPWIVKTIDRMHAASPALVQGIGVAIKLYAVTYAALFLTGSTPLLPERVASFRIMMANWILFAGAVSALIVAATLSANLRRGVFARDGGAARGARGEATARPGLLWIIPVLVGLNSLSPYIGYKTTGAVSMYSNLRTEGGENNHIFMPVVPIFGFQDDLVEVVDANHPEIETLKGFPVRYSADDTEMPVYVTYVSLRRAVAALGADDLKVTYLRSGEERTFVSGASANADPDLDRPLPFWLDKTARFRPVFQDASYCMH